MVGLSLGGPDAVLVGLLEIDGITEGEIVVGATDTGGLVGVPQLSIQIDLSLQ